jgi:hypothetical protein
LLVDFHVTRQITQASPEPGYAQRTGCIANQIALTGFENVQLVDVFPFLFLFVITVPDLRNTVGTLEVLPESEIRMGLAILGVDDFLDHVQVIHPGLGRTHVSHVSAFIANNFFLRDFDCHDIRFGRRMPGLMCMRFCSFKPFTGALFSDDMCVMTGFLIFTKG